MATRGFRFSNIESAPKGRRRVSLVSQQRSPRCPNRTASEARAVIAWLGQTFGKVPLIEVGQFCQRNVGTMSSAVRRIKVRAEKDSHLAAIFRNLKQEIISQIVYFEVWTHL